MSSGIDERKWLFTARDNDLRGNLAGKVFFNGEKVARGSKAAEFMSNRNYSEKPAGARDDEVNPEFTQFIIDAALHARKIDAPLGVQATIAAQADPAVSTLITSLKTQVGAIGQYIQANPTKSTTYIDIAINKVVADNSFAVSSFGLTNTIGEIKRELENLPWDSSFKTQGDHIIDSYATAIKNAGTGVVRASSSKTLADSQDAKKAYENIFAKWDQLSQSAQYFYKTYVDLLKRDGGNWREATQAEYGNAGSDPSNYKLNLKKESIGGALTLAKHLIKYDISVFTGIWIGNKMYNNTEIATLIPNQAIDQIFSAIFQEIYANGSFATIPQTFIAPSANTMFHVKVDSLIRQQLKQISDASVQSVPMPEHPEHYKLLDMTAHNVISRDASGHLVRTINGQKVPYGLDDAETVKAFQSTNKCFGTDFTDNPDQCKKFIFECLLSQDGDSLEKCLKSLKDVPDFFKHAKADIQNLHPVLALRILQQFGFRSFDEYDHSAGVQLRKVESVKMWMKGVLEKKFPAKELEALVKQPDQEYIFGYLDLVSQYVNANPTILNKNYAGTTEEARGLLKKSNYAEKLGIDWEIGNNKRSFVYSDVVRLRGYLQQVRAARSAPFTQVYGEGLFTPFGRQFTPGVGMLQSGGCGSTCDLVIKKLNSSNHVTGAQLIEHYMDAVIRELSNKNKTLNQTDKNRIKAQLEKYRELESALWKSLCYIDTFNGLTDELRDYKSQILTEDNMKKLVERYSSVNDKMQSTESQLVDIIAKIQESMGDNMPKKGISVGDWM